ncbi:asparaginyl tRNA synthetase [Sarcoptes scabiei]|nr:asparaginyl tRNA synthetase [Sarcoptes scabiei]
MIERQNDKYNAINPAIGFLISLTSTVAINQFNYVLDCPSIYPKNIIESNQTYHYWRFRNFLISFFHASLTGFVQFHHSVLLNPTLLTDVIDTYSYWGYLLTSFSLGYFVYDTIEMLRYVEKKGTFELVLHHFMVMGCFSNTIFYNRFIGLNMIALLIELSNIFLHFRQLLLLSNYSKHSRLYHINSIINMSEGLCMYWIWHMLLFNLERLPLITKMTGLISMTGISVTTIILFKRIFKSDFGQLSKPNSIDHKYSKAIASSDDDFTQ